MKTYYLLFLAILSACASSMPNRDPASEMSQKDEQNHQRYKGLFDKPE